MNDGPDDHASVEMLNATLDDCRHGAMDANGVAIDLIGQANAGPSAARNRGIAAAETPFVVVLDGDGRLRPAFIERTLSMLSADKRWSPHPAGCRLSVSWNQWSSRLVAMPPRSCRIIAARPRA